MQILRAEREQTESEMEALEKEKEAIKHILPRGLRSWSSRETSWSTRTKRPGR